jgi:hypothetical protein
MLCTAVAPEVLISKNVGDIVGVKLNLKRLQELAAQDGVPWTTTHSLFANMGGFVIRSHVPERFVGLADAKTGSDAPELEREPSGISHNAESEGMERVESALNGGHRLSSNEKDISKVEIRAMAGLPEHSNPYHLLASDILALREANLLTHLPYITKSELNDKSKSDGLVRFIAVVQVLWTVIQISIRHARHLAISQLEIAVVAFSICAIIIYGLNWEKPKGVQVPYTLLQFSGEIPRPIFTKLKIDPHVGVWEMVSFGFWYMISLGQTKDEGPLRGSPIRNTTNIVDESNIKNITYIITQLLGLLLGGLAFGSIHVLAWNFVFPTVYERTLWRVASILCTTTPLLFFSAIAPIMWTYAPNTLWGIIIVSQAIMIVLYVFARLALLLEIFRTLCFLPPSAFVATWATNVPHVA